jgi:protein-S-isoprenylcysteine O-methyltransferase Ste14
MPTSASVLPRILYGALFVILLPAGLVLWARALDPLIGLTAVQSTWAGVALVAGGATLMLAGMTGLMAHGNGLPMNAFPPARYVRTGVFRWIRNPIYIGFGLTVPGVAIIAGSAAGLWIVAPTAALGAAALWFGYERHALLARFGASALERPMLSFPPATEEPARPSDRAAVLTWVLLPWLVSWLVVQALGPAPDAFRLESAFERNWPVIQVTQIGYMSGYLFVPLTVLVISVRRDLRRFAISGVVATAVVMLLWLTIPVVASNRPFAPANLWGRLLAFEQSHSNGVAAFPAFHVIWALIAMQGWIAKARTTGQARWRWIGIAWATLIVVSCLTTAQHTIVEVLAGLLVFFPCWHYATTWELVRRASERLANSWHEWRIGPVRIINHGIYPAAGAFVGSILIGMLTGPRGVLAIAWVGVMQTLGAGLTAQVLEGSSKLLRPFGWYGGVLGAAIGCLTAPLVVGMPILPLLAAFAIAAPWIQAIGRLRCLVQGCCHGQPASDEVGIRYHHRRSRVSQIANLADVPLHPTPLYSILSNVVIGIVLLRLRFLGAPDGLELGIYFILAGLARFVEESYRGEPQTRQVGGLHIYQWFTILSVLAGMVCTTLPSEPAVIGLVAPAAGLWWVALAMGLLSGAAMGVDFPNSNRRFSRLAAAD